MCGGGEEVEVVFWYWVLCMCVRSEKVDCIVTIL